MAKDLVLKGDRPRPGPASLAQKLEGEGAEAAKTPFSLSRVPSTAGITNFLDYMGTPPAAEETIPKDEPSSIYAPGIQPGQALPDSMIPKAPPAAPPEASIGQNAASVLSQVFGAPPASAAEMPRVAQFPSVQGSYTPPAAPPPEEKGLEGTVTYDPAEWSNGQYIGPRADGGRVAYKSGGKVGADIEPLVQNLMRSYKQAKTDETVNTKPLLQHSDKTIVRALHIAKKAF